MCVIEIFKVLFPDFRKSRVDNPVPPPPRHGCRVNLAETLFSTYSHIVISPGYYGSCSGEMDEIAGQCKLVSPRTCQLVMHTDNLSYSKPDNLTVSPI